MILMRVVVWNSVTNVYYAMICFLYFPTFIRKLLVRELLCRWCPVAFDYDHHYNKITRPKSNWSLANQKTVTGPDRAYLLAISRYRKKTETCQRVQTIGAESKKVRNKQVTLIQLNSNECGKTNTGTIGYNNNCFHYSNHVLVKKSKSLSIIHNILNGHIPDSWNNELMK